MVMEGIIKSVISWIVMGFIVCSGTWAAVEPSEEFFGSVSLVNNDVYHLFWKSNNTSITFEVHAKVKGWVGFGLSPNGGMAKSDIVIGWVKDGVPYFKDRYAEQEGNMPTIDTSQDWTLLEANETATHTILKFIRPLSSCDPEDRQVTADTMRVIFAYSDRDPSSEDAVIYHEGNRGTKSILLITSHEKPSPMPADAFYKDFLNNNVSIPQYSDTTYWCQGFNAPNITEKHHLFKIEPIVQPGNEAIVHHILLYACYHRPDGIEQVNETQGSICWAHNMPWKECTVVIAGWAVGGTPYNFPEHVGLPFGDSGGILFLKTETHYDNSQLVKGIIDSSGLRLWFTKSLRQYDAALLETGMDVTPVGHILPAGYPSLTSHGHCTKECLSMGMGSVPEIYVFSILLHTHLLGTGVRVHHYQDGVEKVYLGSDLAYDFNFQESRVLAPEITIKKGDNLVVECIYNTMNKKDATFGGLGTPQEMCLAYMYYYPRTSFLKCTSVPTQANMAEHLSLKYEGGQSSSRAKIIEGPYSGKTLNEVIQAIGKFPNQATMDKYQEAITTGEIVQQCRYGYSYTRKTTHVPKVVSPYQEAAGQCSGALPHQPPGGTMLMMVCFCELLMILATKLTTN